MRLHRPSHATVVAYVALFFAMSGTAYAATGGTFLIGKSNYATTATGLTNSAGTALSLASKTGYPPLAVNQTVKVSRLNADLLDGVDSSALQRRVSGTCNTGSAIVAVSGTGSVTCHLISSTNMVVTASVGNIDGNATCPSGWLLTGGGFQQPFVADETKRDLLRESKPDGFGVNDTWSVTFDPRQVNGFQLNQPTYVYAVCIKTS